MDKIDDKLLELIKDGVEKQTFIDQQHELMKHQLMVGITIAPPYINEIMSANVPTHIKKIMLNSVY